MEMAGFKDRLTLSFGFLFLAVFSLVNCESYNMTMCAYRTSLHVWVNLDHTPYFRTLVTDSHWLRSDMTQYRSVTLCCEVFNDVTEF